MGIKECHNELFNVKNFDSEKVVGGSVTLTIETYYLVVIIVHIADITFSLYVMIV